MIYLDVIRQVLEELEAAGVQHHVGQVAAPARLLLQCRHGLRQTVLVLLDTVHH